MSDQEDMKNTTESPQLSGDGEKGESNLEDVKQDSNEVVDTPESDNATENSTSDATTEGANSEETKKTDDDNANTEKTKTEEESSDIQTPEKHQDANSKEETTSSETDATNSSSQNASEDTKQDDDDSTSRQENKENDAEKEDDPQPTTTSDTTETKEADEEKEQANSDSPNESSQSSNQEDQPNTTGDNTTSSTEPQDDDDKQDPTTTTTVETDTDNAITTSCDEVKNDQNNDPDGGKNEENTEKLVHETENVGDDDSDQKVGAHGDEGENDVKTEDVEGEDIDAVVDSYHQKRRLPSQHETRESASTIDLRDDEQVFYMDPEEKKAKLKLYDETERVGEFPTKLPHEEDMTEDHTILDNADSIDSTKEFALFEIRQYAKTENNSQKLIFVRSLPHTLTLLGEDLGVKYFCPLLKSIASDASVLKEALLEVLSDLAQHFIKNFANGYQLVADEFVPIMTGLLKDQAQSVRDKASLHIVSFTKMLTEDDRGRYILTTVLDMAHDDENQDHKVSAILYINALAPTFGKDLCEQFIALEIIAFAEDQLRIRKVTAQNLVSVCQTVGKEFFLARLLPLYMKLASDNVWGVRKICVENLVQISDICPIDIRTSQMVELFKSFVSDPSRWVKLSAFEKLGSFIATMVGHEINPTLIEYFQNMADPTHQSLSGSGDNEVVYYCAYNFPAVVLTLGKSRWPDLRRTYFTLVKDLQWKVRRTLACSIHEIAKVIEREQAEKDLIAPMDTFLKDIDEVRFGALKHLGEFLQVLSPETRENYIDIIVTIQNEQYNWRLRELLASQVGIFGEIFSEDTTATIVMPIVMKLCHDNVSSVRDKAVKGIAKLVRRVYDSGDMWQATIIDNVKTFSLSQRFNHRQSFVKMCENLVEDPFIFKRYFLKDLLAMKDDTVPNVKITLSRSLSEVFQKSKKFKRKFERVLKEMLESPHPDVRYYAQLAFQDYEPSEGLSESSDSSEDEDEKEEEEEEEKMNEEGIVETLDESGAESTSTLATAAESGTEKKQESNDQEESPESGSKSEEKEVVSSNSETTDEKQE